MLHAIDLHKPVLQLATMRGSQSNNDESAEHERLAAPLEVHHGRIVRTISPGSSGEFGGWVLKLESATYGLVFRRPTSPSPA